MEHSLRMKVYKNILNFDKVNVFYTLQLQKV